MTLRLTVGEVCPPGFVTAIGTSRATAMSASFTETVSWPGPTNVVARGTLSTVTEAPS